MTREFSELKKQADLFFEMGFENQRNGRLKGAVGCYKKSLEFLSTAEAHTYLGWAYALLGKLDDAIAECKKAITADPNFGNPYNDIGAYLIERGSLDEAVPWLERAIKAGRYQERMFPHYNLGRIWEIKGRYVKARECYRAALKENPRYKSARTALARVQAVMN